MDSVHLSCFARGEVLRVIVPDVPHPQKRIQRQRNLLVDQKVERVIILGSDENNSYIAVPCNTKHKKGAIPVRVGYFSFYAHIKPLLHIDAEVLHRSDNSELYDKVHVLNQLEDKIRRHNVSRERRKNEFKTQNDLSIPSTKAIIEDQHKRRGASHSPQQTKVEKKQINSSATPSPQNIKGYKVVSLTGLNRKAFKKRIILADYAYDECPECNNRLVKFVNFIQINEVEGIRVPGRYCTKCDTFYEERGIALKQLSAEGLSFYDYTLNTDYLILHYSQKIRLSHSIKSASIAVHVHCKEAKENRLVTIVSDRSDRNHEQDVFHYSDWFARRLLYEIFKQSRSISVAGNTFNLLKIFRLDWNNCSLLSQLKIDTIVLRTGGGLYGGIHQHGTELVDILLYSPFTDCFEVTHATYDTENGIYYMDAKVFRSFVEKYGNPGVKVAAYQCGARDFSTMREESILHAYGYVVGNNGLSTRARQILLSEVMDLGIMSSYSILSLLDLNISMHPGDKYENARYDWEIDKQFVLEYKVNPDRFVIATIGL